MRSNRAQDVNEIFQSALDRAPDERVAYLDQACGDDAELRREVESFISAHDRAGNFMDRPAIEAYAAIIAGRQVGSQDVKVIGRYKILSEIGRGGMGEVYLAEDETLGRRVALKMLPEHLTRDQQRLLRFEQEARTASALNHPNIITIHEILKANATHVIATEFVEGETLRDRLRHESPTIRDALDIAIQIADALTAAHKAGIVHRDIKPENIMIRPDGYVKVLDFGLAKLVEPSSPISLSEAPTQRLNTAAGIILGTIDYMSPEQARGKDIDARTDIFSLGAVIYEMMAHRKPFAGETFSDTLAAILESEPPPISHFTSEAPAELTRIVTKSLRKNRDERYQTSKDLFLDLKNLKEELDFERRRERSISNTSREPYSSVFQISSGASPSVALSSAEYVVTKIKRHRVAAITTALIGIAVVAFALTSYWRSLRASNPAVSVESIAVLPFANESGSPDAEYLSDGMTETLINSLSQLPGVNVKARSSVFRYKGKDVSPQTVGKELGVQAVLNGRVIQHGSDLTLYLSLVNAATENQLWGKQYNQKLTDLVTLQTQIAQDVSENLKARLTRAEKQNVTKSYTTSADAYRLYLQGRYFWNKRTERDLRKSVDYFGQALSLDPNYALAYSGLADGYSALGLGFNFAPSVPQAVFPKAKQAALKALAMDNNVAEAHVSLGLIKERWDWDFAGAEAEYKRGIELDPNYAEGPHRYGVFLAAMGRFDEAIIQLERARALDPLSMIIASDRARPYFLSRRYDHALDVLRQAVDMDPNFIRARTALALEYARTGRYEEAITEEKRAFELTGGPIREDGTRRINDLLAIIYAQTGRKTEALKILAEMDKEEKQGPYVYPFVRAAVYAELGDKEKAFEWLEKAYAARSPAMVDLKTALVFDKIRDDPRFADLVRRVGFPQ
jgi:eukaryotic-like serine/threonine-protein kinase